MAGPYHRNIAGNLVLIDAMTSDPDEAKAILSREKVSILAVCVKGADELDFIAASPNGFLKKLVDGTKYNWLEPVESSAGNALRFWRVKI